MPPASIPFYTELNYIASAIGLKLFSTGVLTMHYTGRIVVDMVRGNGNDPTSIRV